MKATAAFCLLLEGVAVLLCSREGAHQRMAAMARVFAIIVGIIGALTLCEYIFGIDFGIDEAVFRETPEEAGQSFPGRMGPAAALNFVLISLGVLLLDVPLRKDLWPTQWLSIAVAIVTSVIFLTYFYGMENVAPLARNLSIAPHSVVAFLLLSAALLLARPKHGIVAVFIGDSISAIAARRILPVILVVPVVLGWLRVLGERSGWFGTAMGTALFVTAMILIFMAMVWCAARDLDRASEVRYQLAAIVDSSEDAIVSKNLEGIVTSWNASAQRIFGYTAEEMLGKPITEIIPYDRQEEETSILARLRNGERVGHFQTVRRTKDGHDIDVSLSVSPVRDARGRIIGASKILRDITREKQIEAALAHERQWLAVTLGSIGDAVIATDSSGVVKLLNPVAEKLTGWSTNEAVGKPLLQVFNILNEKTRIHAPNPVDRVLREGTIVGLANHTALISRDGREISIEDSAAPIKDAEGNVLGAVMVFHDVTERRKGEETVRIARDAAVAANRAKDEFLAALSHELRTPLTPVLMLAKELEHAENVPVDLRADFSMIRQNIELEARLIDDLLDLTRIAQGKLALRFTQVDTHLLLKHALEILRNDIQAKELTVALDLEAPEQQVSADPVRLQQVLWNLVKNAVKFNARGGRIVIRSWNEDGRLRLSITDTGMGITSDELPRIFDSFAQGSEAAEAQFGGLGLGLSISAVLVREHGGRIWAESPGRNQGATFHIELPLAPVSRAERLPEEAVSSFRGRPLRILLVEDHEPTRETLERLLKRRGHHVETAETIERALQIANANELDVVVSDLGLPDGDGKELMRRLNRDPKPVGIALSGYGMKDDVEESKKAGFMEHFTKPVDVPRLEGAMYRLLGVI
jgi:two-component system CheB/CheR fusion protein